MKKKVLAILAVVMMVVLGVSMVACASNVEGKYVTTQAGIKIYMEVNAGGKGRSYTLVSGEETGVSEFTWVLNGEKFDMTTKGITMSATLKDGKIVVSAFGMDVITYTKE